MTCSYTLYLISGPEPVSQTKVTETHEHNVTLMWNSSNMCESFNIGLSPENNNGNATFVVSRTENTTSYTLHNLTAGKIYNVTIVAVAGNFTSSPYITEITTSQYILFPLLFLSYFPV